jgi:hypothetical protein
MTEVASPASDILPIPSKEAGFYPDVYYTTLGRWPVAACNQAEAEGMPEDRRQTLVAYRLNSSRNRLRRLSPDQSERFDEICDASVPETLRGAKDGDTSWQDWLVDGTTDEQLLEYARWHVASIEEQQHDPAIRAEVAVQRERFRERFLGGVEEGWLHPDAASAIDMIDGTKVYIGDVFQTWLAGTRGEHLSGRGEIIIAGADAIPVPGVYEATRLLIKRIGRHELMHVMGKLGVRWLNEATTEHSAQVLEHGELEELDPDNRPEDDEPIYVDERKLLRYVLQEGRERIPVELATLAYTEHHLASKDAFYKFRDAVDRAWNFMMPDGQGAFAQLNIYVGSLERRYLLQGLPSKQANERAVAQALRDIEYQPETVFGGDPEKRAVTLNAFSSSS